MFLPGKRREDAQLLFHACHALSESADQRVADAGGEFAPDPGGPAH